MLCFLIVIGALFCGAGYYYGRGIPFIYQWPLFEALRNTASIIFAVVGAWLAIIYPERLKMSFGKLGEVQKKYDNMGLLLTPAVHSSFILIALLLIGIVAPLLKQIPELAEHYVFLRGASFVTLTILTLWQVVIVVMTLFPAEIVKTYVDREEATREVIDMRAKLTNRDGD